MEGQITQQTSTQAVPLHRLDDREYWTTYQGRPVKLYWSEMTRAQKLLQIEAEARAIYAEQFVYC